MAVRPRPDRLAARSTAVGVCSTPSPRDLTIDQLSLLARLAMGQHGNPPAMAFVPLGAPKSSPCPRWSWTSGGGAFPHGFGDFDLENRTPMHCSISFLFEEIPSADDHQRCRLHCGYSQVYALNLLGRDIRKVEPKAPTLA